MNGIELNNRTLWQDGSSTVAIQYLYDQILSGEDISKLFVEEITPEIKNYNKHVASPLKVKQDVVPLSLNWRIPESYKDLQLRTHMLKRLEDEIAVGGFSDSETERRIARVQEELELWHANGMDMLLRALIYMVHQFEQNNVVWGTGRGSSCSSYLLYLIGLHDVDSVHYNLDIRDFFRD